MFMENYTYERFIFRKTLTQAMHQKRKNKMKKQVAMREKCLLQYGMYLVRKLSISNQQIIIRQPIWLLYNDTIVRYKINIFVMIISSFRKMASVSDEIGHPVEF